MEQMEIDGRKKYEDLTEELRRTQESTVENFIIMGFILKQVEAECLYRFDGFKDIYEYGKKKFGQSRSTVSRCKNINTKYSVGGNSRELLPEYRGYCRSTLQEMLDLTESDMGLITANTPVDQVKELKEAKKEQQRLEKIEQENNLPLVQMAADTKKKDVESEQQPIEPFDAVMTAFWCGNRELYSKVAAGLITPEILAEEISPSGSMTCRNGVNIMFFYDIDKGLKLRSYANGKAGITQYTYQELIDRTRTMNLDPAGHHEKVREAEEDAGNGKTTDDRLQELVAPPQQLEPGTGSDGQPVPYDLVHGQTSVSDLQGVVPDKDTAVEEGTDTDIGTAAGPILAVDGAGAAADGNIENVVDGEYRELDEGMVQMNGSEGKTGEEYPYTEVEIRNAISFFDIEYARMIVLQQDTAKRRNYKIALECIRRCYKPIAEQVDSAVYRTGV